MGVLRFRVARTDDVPDDVVERALVVSLEGVPWTCRVEREGDELRIIRSVSDSGYTHVPWRTSQYGELMLSTATVLERTEPYQLLVELARGTIHRVATQLAEWELSGLQGADGVHQIVREAKSSFARAVAGGGTSEQSDAEARAALDGALDASESLMALYTAQVIAMRRKEPQRIPTWLACNLGHYVPAAKITPHFTAAFNAAAVPLSWRATEPSIGDLDWSETDRQVEWSAQAGLRVCGGPLLSLDSFDLPDWLYLWEDDIEAIAGYAGQHVERTVRRYRDRVHLWHCAARMNSGQALPWNEDERLQMTAMVLEIVRRIDSQTPIIVSVDQPWGEYMSRSDTDLAPMYFADALLRANLGVTGVGIELNYGYAIGGMSARDRLAISRKLDQWSLLGVPIAVFVTVPSSAEPDPLARSSVARSIHSPTDGKWQQRTAEALLSMLMSKRYVQVIVWNQWTDQVPHRFPHGGVLDARGQPKPALEMFQSLRRNLLG